MNASKKIIPATGEKVFTHAGKGLWTARLYDHDVLLDRAHHNHWKCVDATTKEVYGEGSTRNEAMREAFYHMVEEEGYDKEEAERLDWILVKQPYRSYGGHKAKSKHKKNSNVVDIHTKECVEDDAEEDLKRIRQDIERYRTAYNATLGGWLFYERGEDGEIVGGVCGPYSSKQEMLSEILWKEIERV